MPDDLVETTAHCGISCRSPGLRGDPRDFRLRDGIFRRWCVARDASERGLARLVRTAENGDTLVVVEAGLSAHPVTDDDRSAHVQGIVERRPEDRRAAEAIAGLMPDFKPVLEGFFLDDEERLRVERATPNDFPPFYDLFSRDGDYLGSVRLAFEPRRSARLTVQHGNLYTWVVDESDTPFVVRAPVS